MIGGFLGITPPAMQRAMGTVATEAALEAPKQSDTLKCGRPEKADTSLAVPAQPQQSEMALLQHWHHLRSIIRDEMSSMMAAQPQRPPMQLIINNHAQANADQKTASVSAPAQQPPVQQPAEDQDMIRSFVASPFNRMVLFSALFIGLYVAQEHLSNKWRMAELQRKSDANLVFRMAQMFKAA